MSSIKKRIEAVLFLLFFSSIAMATDYVVSGAGSNDANGTYRQATGGSYEWK